MEIFCKKYKSNYKQVKATFWFTICNVLQKGILFLAVPIYTRILTADQYGSYSVFLSWLEIFEILATFRLGWGGYVVGLAKYNNRDAYTSSMQCLSIFITSVLLGVYLLFSDPVNSFTNMDTQTTLLIFVILYALPAIQFWTVRKRVEHQYKSVLIVTVISSLLILFMGVWAALWYEQKDTAVIGARAVVQGMIACILIWENCRRKFVIYDKNYWKRALRFNTPLLPYYLSMVLLHGSDKIIIKNLIGRSQAGIYGVAYSASMCMQLFSSSINQALQPWIYSKLRSGEIKGVYKSINFSLIIVAGLNLLLIFFAPEIIGILAPGKYQDAIWVIPPLASSVVVMSFYQHFVNIEFYYEESKSTAMASIGAALLNIFLNYLLIPILGYMAAGYTTLISYLVFAFTHYKFMCKVCQKYNCPLDIIDIKTMLFILLIFFAIAAIMTIGYFIPLIRYGVLSGSVVLLLYYCFKLYKRQF